MPLLEIQNDRGQKGESGFGCTENNIYSLYLLKDITQIHQEQLDHFWNRKTTYTVVTRIHCDYPEKYSGDKQPFALLIEQYCLKQIAKEGRAVFCASEYKSGSPVFSFDSAINKENTEKEKVDCLFYGSLELGDTVAIMKSRSIAAILEVIHCLSAYKYVRDTYSYCGIDRTVLQKNDQPVSSFVTPNAELGHISTRYSVRNVQNAEKFFGMLHKQLGGSGARFYVTGTADQSIHWDGCSEEQLLKIMRIMTQNGKEIHYCFNDVITRIGICQKLTDCGDATIQDTDIRKLGNPIPDYDETMKWLRKEYDNYSEINWKYSLLKLLGTLEAMYTNYVMDDLANLFIPSVKAFLIRLNHLRNQNGKTIPDEYDDEIIDFLNHWTSLMNEISQLESQLTQHPEFVPVKYYIPAMILQFELHFVKYCCQALSEKQSRQFVPMLLPADLSDLQTYCPLDPKQEAYDLSCPLLVFIPLMDLYRPWETAFRIAHEMAHYCEDSSRNRELRYEKLTECAVRYVVNCWYGSYIASKDGSEDPDLQKKSDRFASMLRKRMEDTISRQHAADQYYLDDTIDYLAEFSLESICSTELLEEYLLAVDPEYFFNHKETYTSIYLKQEQSNINHILIATMQDYLALLRFLCGECYADTAMVVLTGCSFEDYESSVYLDQYTRFKQREPHIEQLLRDPYVMRQVVRMALVIDAISQLPGSDASWQPDSILKNTAISSGLTKYAATIVKDIRGNGKKSTLLKVFENGQFASTDDILCIKEYLKKCAEDLANALQSPNRIPAVEEVRSGIRYVKKDAFDWTMVQKYILKD